MENRALLQSWQEVSTRVERELERLLALPSAAAGVQGLSVLNEAMRYTALGGGKRFRAFLAVAACQAAGGDAYEALPFACALEMIHAYSLIHDDLPAMDNDDWRRGRPSNHKVFGEAMAILAGDALLTDAFALLAGTALRRSGEECRRWLRALEELAVAAGSVGMVGGQACDIWASGAGEGSTPPAVDERTLREIHTRKTGALIRAAVRGGALIGGADEERLALLTRYAEALGLAYQISDDLLDAAARSEPASYPALLGLEGSRRRLLEVAEEARGAAGKLGQAGDLLQELVTFIVERRS
ncbi:MAG: polyprenyl synthetase family protein [Bacillota bacterium]|nr:polyprenyl synthetase family protein [Bacillota bacterium]